MKKGRPPGGDAQETRARILRAAELEFAAAGYDGARTVAIARRAGLTHAMLHYYFESKEKLYRAVVEGVLTALSQHLSKAVRASMQERSASPPLQGLMAEAHKLFSRHPRFIRIMLWEIAAGAPRVDAIAGALFDRMADVVRESGRLGLVRRGHDPRDVAVTLAGALLIYFSDEPLVLRLFGRRRFGPEACRRRAEHLRALADLLVEPTWRMNRKAGGRNARRKTSVAPAGLFQSLL